MIKKIQALKTLIKPTLLARSTLVDVFGNYAIIVL